MPQNMIFPTDFDLKKMGISWNLIGYDFESNRDELDRGTQERTSVNFLINTCLRKVIKDGKFVTETKSKRSHQSFSVEL